MTDHLPLADRRLLAHLAQGKTMAEAALACGLREQSAKNRLALAYAELGVKNRVGAFLALGWLTPPEVP